MLLLQNSIEPNPTSHVTVANLQAAAQESVSVEWSLTRRAFSLAVGSLLLAGCFALMLVVGRLPVKTSPKESAAPDTSVVWSGVSLWSVGIGGCIT